MEGPSSASNLTPSSSNNLSDLQHREQDEAVRKTAVADGFREEEELSTRDCAVLLGYIIQHSKNLKTSYRQFTPAIKLIRENPNLDSALKEAWRTQDYKEIRKSNLLNVPNSNKNRPDEQEAIEKAWNTKYRGKAPEALLTRIQQVMKQENLYVRHLVIVQSSGTGKSRMIEELSKKHLVIPVNLRPPHQTGYPPSDSAACHYLCEALLQEKALVRVVAFLRAVFMETSNLISKSLPHNKIVTSFSELMSEGMTCNSHGHQRQSFYNQVVAQAMMLEEEIIQTFAANSCLPLDNQLASVGICEDFEALIKDFKRPHNQKMPLVILAFDEARTLEKPPDESWTYYSELCRALRVLNHQPLLSLFLTTTGNPPALVPKDLSAHMHNQEYYATRPFADLGFDHFAIKDEFDLRIVAGDKHICHLGRPLWATRYEEGNNKIKSRIVQYAALKLRAGRADWPEEPLNATEKLACLAQRLPIEFHSVTNTSKMKEIEQVEGHMRILLRLDAGFESLATVSASEPLLSEAAYSMMRNNNNFKAAEALERCLKSYSIHKGDRGELLVMLLFILARDHAVGKPDQHGRPRRRWCTVAGLMKALFQLNSLLSPLKDLFADSKVFFNHWVKVHQYELVEAEYLAQLMRRGAALLCATDQVAIDGIIPFLLAGYGIFPRNIGVILWQAKTDPKFTHKPVPRLFEAMDPYELGILDPRDKIPIIRIVFALASPTPCLTHVPRRQDGLQSYDLWVGGISPTVFSRVKQERDGNIWTALLHATNGLQDKYKNPNENTKKVELELRQSMNPATAADGDHWTNWANFREMRKIKTEADACKGREEDEPIDEDESTDEDDPMNEDQTGGAA